MDGVIADLHAHAINANKVKHYLALTRAQWDEYYRGVDAETMFASLDPYPTTPAVIDLIVSMFGEYRILSRPLEFDVQGSVRGKNTWLDTHVAHQPVERFFTPDKWKYATQADGTPNILIDDNAQNIHLWREHGGIPVYWQADTDSFAELKELLINAAHKVN